MRTGPSSQDRKSPTADVELGSEERERQRTRPGSDCSPLAMDGEGLDFEEQRRRGEGVSLGGEQRAERMGLGAQVGEGQGLQ